MTNSTISDNTSTSQGAGIFVFSNTVTITGTTFSGNHAADNGGGINNNSGTIMFTDGTISGNQADDRGGGVYSNNNMTFINSTISGNQAVKDGGGIRNGGTLTLINSTISGNQTNEDGGGIYDAGNTLTVTNSTISDNNAGLQGDGIRFSSATVTFQNTIIANGPDDNCYSFYGDPLGSLGGNLSDDDTCDFTEPSDLNDTEADLGPLADNGGPTRPICRKPAARPSTTPHVPSPPTNAASTGHRARLRHRSCRGVGRRAAAALRQRLYRRCLQPG